MLAKYYPGTGWYQNSESRKAYEKIEQFLEKHSHGTQWGANIVSELEIPSDENVIMAPQAVPLH